MNLRRLNYILIPETAEGWQRYERSRFARFVFGIVVWGFNALSREGRVLVLLALFAGIAGLDVASSQNHVLWAALTATLAGSLAVRGLFRMPEVAIDVRVPPRVSVGEEATFELLLHHRGKQPHHTLAIERPFLHWDGTWIGARPTLPVLEPNAETVVRCRATFLARGWHDIDRFRVAATVPFRMALGPPLASPRSRVLVVPKIARVHQVRVPVTARFQPGGVALASKTGESMELFGLRPYRRGDRLRDLHAKTWARLGEPVVRDYRQEYFARIGVVVDTDLAVTDEDTLEAALSVTAGIVAHLSRGEALIDLLVTGRTLHTLTLGRSLGTFEQALDHLGAVKPGPAFEPDFVSRLLAPYVGRLSSLVFVAVAWDAPRQKLVRQITEAGVSCKVVLVGKGSGGIGIDRIDPDVVRRGEPILL
jgi:uncharacterized protein (DUF58 family)